MYSFLHTENCLYEETDKSNLKCFCSSDSHLLTKPGINTPKKDNTPLLQCTRHMCPVRVHWHVKLNYQKYWRVKIAITNFNYRMNYTDWTLVVQHPNLNNVTQVFSFSYKPLLPYGSISKFICLANNSTRKNMSTHTSITRKHRHKI